MNNKKNEYKIIKYIDGDFELDVRFSIDDNTVWLNTKDISMLFDRSVSVIGKHVRNILKETLPNKDSVMANFAYTADDGRTYNVDYYNLDIILAVGYRTKSNRITKFNNWVKEALNELKNESQIQKPFNYANNYEIVKFESGNISLDINVSPSEDTVWLTKDQIAILFDRNRSVISRHINNIFIENELEEKSNVHFLHIANSDKRVQFFSLDVIISVGYRVKSRNGLIFRKWANKVLKEYLIKGYSINDDRSLVTNENYINLINRVDSMDIRLKKVENNELYFKNEKLIVDGELFDALSYLEELVSHANNKILIVDPYIDSKALNILKYVKDNVIVKITTSSTKSRLTNNDIKMFMKQYNKKINKFIDDDFHDRYLFIDDLVFHLGSSINYLGRRIAQIDKLEDEGIISYLKNRVKYNNL